MAEIRIRMSDPERTTIHRFRDFGEDIWRTYREAPRVEVDLGEINRANVVFSIHVRNGLVGRIARHNVIADEVIIERER